MTTQGEPATDLVENHPFDEVKIGDSAQLTRTLRADDIALFAAVSGDCNPTHVDADYASSSPLHGVVAHGMWGAALISAVLGTDYPGAGSVYISQSLSFLAPLLIGDTLEVQVRVIAKDECTHQLTLDCRGNNQAGVAVITGTAVLIAPSEKVKRARVAELQVRVSDRGQQHRRLLALTRGLPPISVAVVHPCSEDALRGALDARECGLIVPILVGPEARIRQVAAAAQIDLTGQRIVDMPHSHAAAAAAVAMARQGDVQALMKGSLHTDELMSEVVKAVEGLRTERRISHVYVLDVPTYPKQLLISDAAINVEPDLVAKRDIVQNAIDLAHALGIAAPKVAILAAVEVVNPVMRSTLDAAALCKMADRGQITGGVLDGPLAFDNAISARAAQDKGIVSPVAGDADILIAPDLEAGNMLAKQLQYLADAQAAGIVLGAKVPIILTSRADEASVRVASCALALLVIKLKAIAKLAA